MANVKITELTAATALAGTDVLPIVDVGADATKKVSVSDLLRNLPDGTASAPALAFADDQNTGVLSPAANELAFATSGTQRLVIDSSGNIGVGTSSPIALYRSLSIHGTTNDTGGVLDLATANQSSRAYVLNDSNGLVLQTATSNNILFKTNNSERARIDTAGRLLLGATTEGNGNADNLTIADSANSGLTIRSGSSNIGSIFFSDATSGTGEYAGFVDYNHSSNLMSLGTASSTRMSIDSSGNLGIGISAPAHGPLHVHSSTTNAYFHLTNSTTGSAASDGFSLFVTGNDTVLNQRESANMRFFTSNSEAMRIDSSGKVQIGRTSPLLSTELTVGGNNGLTVGKTNGSRIGMFGSFNQDLLIIGTYDDFPVVFRQNNTERMRIDSSGDVEIMQGKNLTWVYQGGSTHRARIRAESSDALIFENGSGNSERMRIDSSGNLLVGTTTANGNMTVNMGTDKNISFNGNQGEVGNVPAFVATNNAGSSLASMGFRATDLRFATGSAERMRITSAGRMYLHGSPNLFISNTASAGTSQVMIAAGHSATDIETSTLSFRVYNNGNVQNTNNSYGQISDVKLKENIVSANSQWDDIKAVQVRNFNFKEETNNPTHTQIGVVAQEIETVSPGLVYETPDRDAEGEDLGTVTKSVNYSVLYMKAVKALQEAMDRIETLEAKVAALEAQ